MIRIGEAAPSARWEEEVLPGVDILFAPITRPAWRAAKRAAAKALDGEGKAVGAEGTLADDEAIEIGGDAFSLELIRRGILEWRGVGDLDGNPIDVTPEAVDIFLSDPRRFDACDLRYVMPFALEQREGNGSAGSPSGTSSRVMPAKTTAGSVAKRAPGVAAKNVRTGSTRPKRKRAKASGR
ncbi:hypothetical protein [Rhizorhabdus histidinilytica]|uniref:hypothetical protein n=1 Tax=Rhizorhabdus histidinilytica TaxID=439228 RepID=UPI0003FF1E8B